MNQIMMLGCKAARRRTRSLAIGALGWFMVMAHAHTDVYGPPHITYPKIDYGQGAAAEQVKRGEYLAKAGNCISCHSDPKRAIPAFAGGAPIETPFGAFYGPNITPDLETGIGRWQEQDFIRAMREGRAPDGSNYFPVFPYLYFNRLSDADLKALWAYFQRVPAVKRRNDEHTVPFPFNIRFAQWGWKLLFFYPYRGRFQAQADQDATWNRGAYLVEGLGHCAMCHTPMNVLGASKRRYHLRGNFIEGYWAPDITSEGLQHHSVADIKRVFQHNQLSETSGPVLGPMVEVNDNSLRYLSDADLEAIAIYLKSTNSEAFFKLSPSTTPISASRGQEIYDQVCVTCHAQGQMGAPMTGYGANWAWRAERGLDTLYRNTEEGYNAMPIGGGCPNCSRKEIEAAVDHALKMSLNRAQHQRVFGQRKPHQKPALRTGAGIYQQACAACHSNAEHRSAPQWGDLNAWRPYLKQNFDTLVRQVLQAPHHPNRGGCADCSTREMVAVLQHLLQHNSTAEPSTDRTLWEHHE